GGRRRDRPAGKGKAARRHHRVLHDRPRHQPRAGQAVPVRRGHAHPVHRPWPGGTALARLARGGRGPATVTWHHDSPPLPAAWTDRMGDPTQLLQLLLADSDRTLSAAVAAGSFALWRSAAIPDPPAPRGG